MSDLQRATRGYGLLEGFLARKRCALAQNLLVRHKVDAILDIGCGSFPLLLSRMSASKRTGLDRVPHANEIPGIDMVTQDIAASAQLPAPDASYDAVTMLAVIEHIPEAVAIQLLSEVHRVLRPGGLVVITTPASWTDGILRFMARVRLVSPEEIDEHTAAYSPNLLRDRLIAAGFKKDNIEVGTFELGMNLWASGVR
ncbi:MAG TPA: class I SAM-dependent methyltransferase [Candidatus Hydrogenedentes bacterium]|nr:class I SAM-dependent methyltransferase [Candidatus Hydrogenedentota bacterium]HRK33310.1 class I SAM-dependent methyltransferase [Candidatus Hydrogenedentota bacterium]